MGNSISKYKKNRILNKVKKDIDGNIKWLYRISREQHERFKNYIINLDQSHRVEINSERRNNVHRGVTEIVERISAGIGEHDSRFKGTLIPMGSSNNHTKIGDCDEYDFVHELDLNALLEGRGTFKRRISINHIAIDIDSGARCALVTSEGSQTALNKDKVKSIFEDILLNVLIELELPTGWQHGGVGRPSFSGLRKQGPSCVLQLDYMDTSDQAPLCLSVDFVPMLRLPISAVDNISELEDFLRQVTENEYCWVPICSSVYVFSYGHAEELFLNKYPSESTPKTLMRILKALRIVSHIKLTSYLDEDSVKQVLRFRKRIDSGNIHRLARYTSVYRWFVHTSTPDHERYVSMSEFGETGGDEYILKSYIIKCIVLSMMSVDESRGHGWTDDDLPELVLMVLEFIFHDGRPWILGKEDIFEQKTISVPLEDFCKTTTRKGSPDTQKLSSGITFRRKQTDIMQLMLRIGLNHASDVCTLSRVAGIAQLLRCVCEGKRTAQLVIYNDRVSHDDSKKLVSKKKLKKMTKKINKTYISFDS